jgi:hypothetical protein
LSKFTGFRTLSVKIRLSSALAWVGQATLENIDISGGTVATEQKTATRRDADAVGQVRLIG